MAHRTNPSQSPLSTCRNFQVNSHPHQQEPSSMKPQTSRHCSHLPALAPARLNYFRLEGVRGGVGLLPKTSSSGFEEAFTGAGVGDAGRAAPANRESLHLGGGSNLNVDPTPNGIGPVSFGPTMVADVSLGLNGVTLLQIARSLPFGSNAAERAHARASLKSLVWIPMTILAPCRSSLFAMRRAESGKPLPRSRMQCGRTACRVPSRRALDV